MRRVLDGMLIAIATAALILCIPTYELLKASPDKDRGGYTCGGAAISTALHPAPDPGAHLRDSDFDVIAACNRDARVDVRDAALLDGVPLVLILSGAVIGSSAVLRRRRSIEVVDWASWRVPVQQR
jgi:hypothetical protein